MHTPERSSLMHTRRGTHTWQQPWPSKTPKKWCLPEVEEAPPPCRKSGLMDTASSISRRRPRTEVTPFLGQHIGPDPAAPGPRLERPGAAHAPLRRLPPPPPPSSAAAAGAGRHAPAPATPSSTLGRRLASAVTADAEADLASSQQISAMAWRGARREDGGGGRDGDRLPSPA